MIPRNPSPSNEERLALAAVKLVVEYALTTPTTYALFQQVLMQALTLPQECKSYYINHLASVFKDDDGDPADWLRFRAKLQAMLLKQQALIQAGDLLLQDWQVNQATVHQMTLFAAKGNA